MAERAAARRRAYGRGVRADADAAADTARGIERGRLSPASIAGISMIFRRSAFTSRTCFARSSSDELLLCASVRSR